MAGLTAVRHAGRGKLRVRLLLALSLIELLAAKPPLLASTNERCEGGGMSVSIARRAPNVLRSRSRRLIAPSIEHRSLVTASLTGVTGIIVYLLVLFTGGTPNSLGHLAYVPISIAAYRAGAKGGVMSALLGTVMLGPVMYLSDLEGNGETGWPWLLRGALFIGVGWLLGWLFDRSRTAVAAWRETAIELTERQHESMTALAAAAEAKDPTTGNHMHRCRALAEVLARETGLTEANVADMGVVGDAPRHRQALRAGLGAHQARPARPRGVRFAARSCSSCRGRFETARRIARWHHENVDGTGYPDGRRGTQIPLEARIVRVVDA